LAAVAVAKYLRDTDEAGSKAADEKALATHKDYKELRKDVLARYEDSSAQADEAVADFRRKRRNRLRRA
jgi:hypothetical protein